MTDLKNFPNCRHLLGKQKIVSEPRDGKTYKIVNQLGLNVEKWEPDVCIFPNSTACDFLFLLTDGKNIKRAHWVEMKGSSVNDAAYQILGTIKKLKLDKGFIPHARIIPSKNPNPKHRSTIYRDMENFILANGGTVKNKNRILEESI